MNEEYDEDPVQLVDGIRVVERQRIALVRVNRTAIVVLLAVTALLAILIAFSLTHFRETRTAMVAVMQPTIPPPPQPTEDPRTLFERWNFAITLPPLWEETETPPPLPAPLVTVHRLYQRADTSCVLAYGVLDTSVRGAAYPETTDRRSVQQNDVLVALIERRMVSDAATTTDVLLSNEAPYTAHEVALSYQPLFYNNGTNRATNNAWVLFSRDESPVTETCQNDFLALLKSTQPYYTPHTLTTRDRGLIYIEYHETLGTLLLFRDATTNTPQILAHLDVGQIFKPTLSNTTLYYVGTNGSLKKTGLLKDTEPQTLPIALAEGESVSDFVIVNGSITYLTGTWCRTDPGTCDLAMHTYTVETGAISTEAEHVDTPDISSDTADFTSLNSLKYEAGDISPGPATFEGDEAAREPFRMAVEYTQ